MDWNDSVELEALSGQLDLLLDLDRQSLTQSEWRMSGSVNSGRIEDEDIDPIYDDDTYDQDEPAPDDPSQTNPLIRSERDLYKTPTRYMDSKEANYFSYRKGGTPSIRSSFR